MVDLAPRVGDVTEDAFRGTFRSFLEQHHPGPEPDAPDEKLLFQRAWAACMHDNGWAAPSWPVQWGGMELPVDKLVPYYEELALARVPAHPSPNAFIVGPTILAFGTAWQQERFLLPIVRGEELWCQGFSEPGAGSDLPSLLTRAERVGDEYIVNGQKLWTSRAMAADWMFALVRTGDVASRQRGLTYLLIDPTRPGITVPPPARHDRRRLLRRGLPRRRPSAGHATRGRRERRLAHRENESRP